MARASSVYYIAPSVISIVPNCNGTTSDLAVTISRGAKVRVYYPDIADLDISIATNTYIEWTIRGRNRRLAESDKPYAIYARLKKTDLTDGYLVFAAKEPGTTAGEWTDPYTLSPNTSSTAGTTTTDRSNGKHTWKPIPSRQAEKGRSDYWWLKLGDVSAPAEGKRTVTLDTGILGTELYNSGWRLNPDDLPDKPLRNVLTDRGSWTARPRVTYKGPTGTRIPDGTLDASVAAALGWEGEAPLTFTTGDPMIEPYHHESLTRHRFIAKRMDSSNDALTDADLYVKLTQPSKGWEEENEVETSRVWRGGSLWECIADDTAETPSWSCTDWQAVGGDQAIYCEILSSAGSLFRNGNVDTILTMSVRCAQEEIGPSVAYPNKTVTWQRMTGWDSALKEFVQTAADRSWTPAYNDEGRLSIVLHRSDMGNGWMTDYRQAQFVCIVDEDGPEPMVAARRIL